MAHRGVGWGEGGVPKKNVRGEDIIYDDLHCATCFILILLPLIKAQTTCLVFFAAFRVRKTKILVRISNMIQ